ncbi:hypothetical protein [Sphingomonas bacterium]|uniref:hypothetical protein n=1 Tax=Sphingomonas bacterium TaxID=1895847 RepID=UPI0015756C7A|nr:hypothetical protein [Sphingomonas bacterium]
MTDRNAYQPVSGEELQEALRLAISATQTSEVASLASSSGKTKHSHPAGGGVTNFQDDPSSRGLAVVDAAFGNKGPAIIARLIALQGVHGDRSLAEIVDDPTASRSAGLANVIFDVAAAISFTQNGRFDSDDFWRRVRTAATGGQLGKCEGSA